MDVGKSNMGERKGHVFCRLVVEARDDAGERVEDEVLSRKHVSRVTSAH